MPENTRIEYLDRDKKLSECILWNLQTDYYDENAENFRYEIPSYVTTNAVVAEYYAELIVTFLQDYAEHLDRSEPVYILEIGSASGELARKLITEIHRKIGYFKNLCQLNVIYVMTDFSPKIIEQWQNDHKLKTYSEAGYLDFAQFNAVEDDCIQLRLSGKTLDQGTLKNPLILIANYIFDSLPQDLFRVDNHQLQEIRVNLYRDLNEVSPETPIHVDHIKVEEIFNNITPNYYQSPILNKILEEYENDCEFASLIFPIGGIECIANLQKITGNNLFTIISDKGFSTRKELSGLFQHTYVTHRSAFSYSVNFHAIARYFQLQGGLSYATPSYWEPIVNFVGVLLQNQPDMEHFNFYCQETLVKKNPINCLYAISRLLHFIEPVYFEKNWILEGCLGLIQMFNYDYAIYQKIGSLLPDLKTESGKLDGQKIDQFLDLLYLQNPELIEIALFQLAAGLKNVGRYDMALKLYELLLRVIPECEGVALEIEHAKQMMELQNQSQTQQS